MVNPKQKWTSEEEEALRAGMAMHGTGKWKTIHKNPEFNKHLHTRTNIDLKDKWRNLSVASGQQIPRDKSKAPMAKASQDDAPATPLPTAQTSASVTPSLQDAPANEDVVNSSRPASEGNNTAKYNDMIFEALSTQPDGSDYSSISAFIMEREQVPQNFRKWLTSRLRCLVQQGRLEMVENRYKIKTDEDATVVPETRPTPKAVQSIGYRGITDAETAADAAYRVAEAEDKAFLAAEAVKEAERICAMAEEMEAIHQFAKDCVENVERGEAVLLR